MRYGCTYIVSVRTRERERVCVCVWVGGCGWCGCDVPSLSGPPFEAVLLPDEWSDCLERALPQAPGSAPYRPY